ncbi:Short-chain dehydrogenase/reductase SDR [Minicystis rosea]|nr:Short-chain dehydrogenase/reductase SDR [Minicystis rosea]
MTAKKVALLTGASTGIGRSMAEALARNGYVAFAGMRDPEGKNRAARDELTALAGTGLAIEALALDVTDDASVNAAVAAVLEKTGHIDLVVNNAGTSLGGLVECSSVDQVKRLFETNFFGAHRVCRAVLPHMRKRRTGLLAFTSSMGGRTLLPNTAHYCATKAAMEMLAEGYKNELRAFEIDVVILEPGLVRTKIFHNIWLHDDEAVAEEYGALGKMVQAGIEGAKNMDGPAPEDVADLLLKLAEMPYGQRPLRTTFGADAALVAPVNTAAEDAARALMAMYTAG